MSCFTVENSDDFNNTFDKKKLEKPVEPVNQNIFYPPQKEEVK
jgi:hypothetical protein